MRPKRTGNPATRENRVVRAWLGGVFRRSRRLEKKRLANCAHLRAHSRRVIVNLFKDISVLYAGGEGGIRTPDTVTRMPHFECGAFNHSATSPCQGCPREQLQANMLNRP